MLETIMGYLLQSSAVQGALITVLLAAIGWLIGQFAHTKHVINLAILSYKYAEKQGLLENFIGTEKLALFMEDFIRRYKDQYNGKDPAPEAKAKAVEVAEREVLKEDHLKN